MNSLNRLFALLVIAAAYSSLLSAQQPIVRVNPSRKVRIDLKRVRPKIVCTGDDVTLTAQGDSADKTIWTVSSTDPPATVNPTTGAQTALHVGKAGTVTVQASVDKDQPNDVTINFTDCPPGLNDEVVRAILGFEQTGASGTSSSQNFLFDFFITRPTFSPRVRWWGDVKVGSFPQQANTELVTFGQQFASTFGNLKVNQLAQSAEFLTGPEFVITPLTRRFQVSLFAGGGANGPNNPSDGAIVFKVPDAKASPAQYAAFTKQFPTVPSGTTNVAFLPDSSNRFLRQWQAGVRLYTFYNGAKNGLGGLPASVEFSFGQNEFVTNSHLSGFVGHVAATHPFTFGKSDGKNVTIYLFGEATNAYTKRTTSAPLPLAPAVDASGNPVPLTDPSVVTVTVPANRRDTYRIGVGIDLVSVITSLWGSNKQAADSGKTPASDSGKTPAADPKK